MIITSQNSSRLRTGWLWIALVLMLIAGAPLGFEQPSFGQEPSTKINQVPSNAPTAARPAPAAEAPANGGIPTTFVEMVRALHYWVIPFALCTLVAVWFTVTLTLLVALPPPALAIVTVKR